MLGKGNKTFSVVVPVKNEVDLILRTLPSYYAIEPCEVLICTDKPTPTIVKKAINRVAASLDAEKITKIVEVERDPEWRYHQAHVRRKGFHLAKYDRILTGDIDLIINKNVHKALNLVGKNKVGLVSLSKFQYPRSLQNIWPLVSVTFLRTIIHRLLNRIKVTTTFTGLYALWRPYWMQSEPEEEIKRLVNPKQYYRGENPDFKGASAITGEDTFLRDKLSQKYRCLSLNDIGAIDIGLAIEHLPPSQFMKGRYFARQRRSLLVSFGRAILRAQPYYLMGHLSILRERHKKNMRY